MPQQQERGEEGGENLSSSSPVSPLSPSASISNSRGETRSFSPVSDSSRNVPEIQQKTLLAAADTSATPGWKKLSPLLTVPKRKPVGSLSESSAKVIGSGNVHAIASSEAAEASSSAIGHNKTVDIENENDTKSRQQMASDDHIEVFAHTRESAQPQVIDRARDRGFDDEKQLVSDLMVMREIDGSAMGPRPTSQHAEPWVVGDQADHYRYGDYNGNHTGSTTNINGFATDMRGPGRFALFAAEVRSKFPFRNDPRKQRWFIIGIGVGILILLALVIGLAVGLTLKKNSSSASNLPLPTSNGGPYTGDLTYYAPGLGACGYTNSASDSICAVSHILFDAVQVGSNPNSNPLCGLKIRLQRDGNTKDVTIVDRCELCSSPSFLCLFRILFIYLFAVISLLQILNHHSLVLT